jgi:CRP/FNR family transcriptional regulator, cyclic AMP receptor protein
MERAMRGDGFIERIPLFASLEADELRDILLMVRPVSFEPGELVFGQGVAADGMYVLQAGLVQLWARFLGEEDMAIARIGAGGVLGEFSLIDRGARSASAEVIEATQGFFFSNRQFELLRADRRPAALKTMRQLGTILCERLRSVSRQLATNAPAFYRCPPRADPRPHCEGPAPASILDPQRVHALPFFDAFTLRELGELFERCTLWTVPRGYELFREGDRSDSGYAIARGAVELLSGSPGAEHRVAIMGPGRLFGVVAPLDGGPRPSTAVVR